MKDPKRLALIVLLAASFTVSPAQAEDYVEGPTWTYRSGDGAQWVGTDSYCGRYGYPAGTLVLEDIEPEDVEVARLGPAHAVLHVANGDVILLGLYLEQGEDCAVGAYRVVLADGTIWSATRRSLTRATID